jgi:phage N-6-adenine-methyltransferase
MPTVIPARRVSVTRKPSLSEMIAASLISREKIKQSTQTALLEWFAQSERLTIARDHHGLRGARWIDFAGRLGVDKSSAYQLVKLHAFRTEILKRCRDEGRWPGWETCLYWYARDPRKTWHRAPFTASTDEFGTPPEIFKRFGTGCTLDVCASKGRAMCADYITKAQDGLKRNWYGVVWLNPPYSDIAPWCAKAVQFAREGGTVVALLPVWSDAPWFHELVCYGEITFLRGKLSYVGRKGYAWFSSMVVVWSPPTVRRKAGAPLMARLDKNGVGRGGRYIAHSGAATTKRQR